MQTIPVLLFALALSGQNAVAGPDPYADVNAMRLAFTHVRSVVATDLFNSGETVVVKYAAPTAFTLRCLARRSYSRVTSKLFGSTQIILRWPLASSHPAQTISIHYTNDNASGKPPCRP